tara:strand:+ start:1018 stop:2286 length:1269 start_codon:yes stop_codon:yes gene_type:complete
LKKYNSFERYIARQLSSLPYLKKKLKLFYQYISYYLNNSSKNSYSSDYIIKKFGQKNMESFFGYYDKCPVNSTNKYILWHETLLSTKRNPNIEFPIYIILADLNGNEIFRFETNTYNWQQGARLQWYKSNLFCFNNYIDKKYVAQIYDVSGNLINTINSPIMDTNSKRGIAVTVDFDRLYFLQPDYGYSNNHKYEYESCPKNDGLYIIDLEKDTKNLVMNFQQLIVKSYDHFHHLINHPMISPNGEYCIFLHRMYKEVGGQRLDRVILLNLVNGSHEEIISVGMASHLIWYDNDTVFGYFRNNEGKDNFYFINIHEKKINQVDIPLFEQTLEDGHPTVSMNNGLICFDTYPDKSRNQSLYLFNVNNNTISQLAYFFHGFEYMDVSRCDLHPRFGVESNQIYFDSVFEGKRNFYLIDLNKSIE